MPRPADRLSPTRRSENMRRIRSKNTLPEMAVRRIVYRLGYRYRLHVKGLPGKPDLVFRPRKKVIFIHGCFWHQHSSCREGRVPGSKKRYWRPKLARNVERDREHVSALRRSGWKTLILWECELGDKTVLVRRIRAFLNNEHKNQSS